MEKLILRKKFKINFRSELCQKKQENKVKLNIQELLKNSGVESILDLNKLIGKIKKHFIESTLDAEFDEHMGYQNTIKIQEDYDSRTTHNRLQILNELTILFPDRLCDINSCYQAIQKIT